jgi:hypothetical protein
MHESKTSKLALLLIGVLVIVIIVIVVSFLAHPFTNPNYLNLEYFFNKILELVAAIIAFFGGAGFWGFIKALLSILAIIFITVIIYTQVLLYEMHQKEHHDMEHDIGTEPETARKKNDKWERVLALGFSPNSSDWRLAIIEAETILEEMLVVLNYPGQSVADRLKAVDPADFKTLQQAWDAHLIRNRIAHDGSDFKLDHDEARRVLGLYERVFKEFDYI